MFLLIICLPTFSQPQAGVLPKQEQHVKTPSAAIQDPGEVTLHYGVEWRLIRAGIAALKVSSKPAGWQGDLHVESAGLVSKLYKVNDNYTVQMNNDLCASSVQIDAQEGKRHRETRISYYGEKGKAIYLERDLVKNKTVLSKEIEVPRCVHDFVGGLRRLRLTSLEPGASTEVPMSDGKKFAQVRVEGQERETVKTPLGTFNTIRYEVFMFNNVLVNKKARLFVWITDDAKRTPVQIRVRLGALVGTITLQLEKEERN